MGRLGRPTVTPDMRVIGYLISIAKKNEMMPQKFLESIVSAWSNGSSKCGKLEIQCIQKAENQAYFRITCDHHVVTQTKVNLKMLTDVAKEDLTNTEPESRKYCLMKSVNFI